MNENGFGRRYLEKMRGLYFTQMMIKYAKELETAPQMMPSGWAAILWLFELR
jgi:hypothetical protein